MRFSDLWRWDGEIGRGIYLKIGLGAVFVKHNLDRLVAYRFFHRPWGPFNYLSPGPDSVTAIESSQLSFFAVMLALSMPFLWIGVTLTLRRLRSAQLPTALVVCFFVPVLNLIFFALLALIPARSKLADESQSPSQLSRFLPQSALGSALMAQLSVVPCALLAVFLGVTGLGRYGWGIFVGLPFCMGMASVLIFGYHRQRALPACLGVASLSIALLGGALLAVAIEGILCLAMAAPLGLILAWLGGLLSYLLQRRPSDDYGGGLNRVGKDSSLLALALSLPALMGAEALARPQAPVYSVTSSVLVRVPPAKVWPRVIEFQRIPPPQEVIFQLGVAYPIQARLEGRGVGAIRRCVFSTGPFVEPITCWDEPRRLAFSVTTNPDPLQEWTPYQEVHPPHLNNTMVSHGGEFRLIALPDGSTRLEGTTWYSHGLWPGPYWKLWSDAIIHTIHLRVLNFIKSEAEKA